MKKQKEDAGFRRFIESHKSVLTGQSPTICCHVRRVKFGSGTAIKPDYYACPMTKPEHDYQHQHGELATLIKYRPQQHWTLETAKEFFENAAIHYKDKWFEGLLMS